MNGLYRISQAHLRQTFSLLRQCGNGRRECQVLWVSPWARPDTVTCVVHPKHTATATSFELNGDWLTSFWGDLARQQAGVRVQVHTHPGSAFHSGIDDDWPLIHTPGFLSLVIPRFALGEVGFEGAFLAELNEAGEWRQADLRARIEVIQ